MTDSFHGLKDIKDALDSSATGFEEFKKINDQRLTALAEGREGEAKELDSKLEKLNTVINTADTKQREMGIENEMLKERIEELEIRQKQPGATQREKVENEYKSNFMQWIRARDPHTEAQLRATEKSAVELSHKTEFKDITIGSTIGGGFALPEEISRAIEVLELKFSPVRNLVKVVQVGSNDYKELVSIHGGTSGWVGETGTRTATGTPNLRERAPTFGEIYSYPQISEWAMDDIFFDAERWLVDDVAADFAQAEGVAVISGDGTNKPTGMTNGAPVATDDYASPLRAAAVYEYIPITSPASPITITGDSLVDLVYSVNSRYRSAGSFTMASTTLAAVRKLKTSDGAYLWEPNYQVGQPANILGYPAVTWEDMPVIADDSLSIAFGDFRRAYVLAERVGLRIQTDAVTNVGYIRFYIRRREGGCPLNNDAVKFLKTAET
jgi:HK97 family phage major capsid protein